MRNLIIAFILLSLQFFWSGCRKDHLIGEFLLTDEMKSQNPFHGGETLYFISDSAKEFVLDGVFRHDHVYKYQPSHNSIDYYLVEVEQTSIGSLLSRRIYMEMGGQINSTLVFTISFSFEGRGGTIRFNLPLNKETTEYVDSIRIMNKWYFNVFINEQDSDTVIRANKLYYSTKYGIIKIEWPDGHYLELEKIEWQQ